MKRRAPRVSIATAGDLRLDELAIDRIIAATRLNPSIPQRQASDTLQAVFNILVLTSFGRNITKSEIGRLTHCLAQIDGSLTEQARQIHLRELQAEIPKLASLHFKPPHPHPFDLERLRKWLEVETVSKLSVIKNKPSQIAVPEDKLDKLDNHAHGRPLNNWVSFAIPELCAAYFSIFARLPRPNSGPGLRFARTFFAESRNKLAEIEFCRDEDEGILAGRWKDVSEEGWRKRIQKAIGR